MKTTLPERSLFMKERLDDIIKEILDTAKNKIAMIILFGSYARGDWVQHEYKMGHTTYLYQSDFDIMIIVNDKYGGYKVSRIEGTIERRLEQKGLLGLELKEPMVTLVTEPITVVNKYLEEGQYFFTDIKKEGILLYDSGEFTLSEARDLPWEEKKEIAKRDYEHWFKGGVSFLLSANSILQRDVLNHSAFELHQATECFYNTILLVFSGYKPKSHDIFSLGQKAKIYYQDLFWIFPYCETKEQKKCFELLRQAYIDARYNPCYKITKEQLLYLIEKVEKLQQTTERICLEYINRVVV